MHIDFLLNIFAENKLKTAIIWRDKSFTYQWLSERISFWDNKFKEFRVQKGEVVSLIGDFSPEGISILLSLIKNENIIVPLNNYSQVGNLEKLKISQSEKAIYVDENDFSHFEILEFTANYDFYTKLKSSKTPGLVLFTSGTS